MANPISTDVIVGTYGRGEARIVVTRHRTARTATLSLSAPSVTLDAAGHHALLQALAFPPEQPAVDDCRQREPFFIKRTIGGAE